MKTVYGFHYMRRDKRGNDMILPPIIPGSDIVLADEMFKKMTGIDPHHPSIMCHVYLGIDESKIP